jgi:hypothetical protein
MGYRCSTSNWKGGAYWGEDRLREESIRRSLQYREDNDRGHLQQKAKKKERMSVTTLRELVELTRVNPTIKQSKAATDQGGKGGDDDVLGCLTNC